MAQPQPGTTGPPPDRWWFVALGAAVAGMAETTLLYFWPTSWVTTVLGVGLAIFAFVMALNPARFFRRMAGACLTLAGLAGAVPGVDAWVDIPGIAQGSLLLDSSPWIALTALVCGCFFGFLEYRTRVARTPAGRKSKTVVRQDGSTAVISYGNHSPAAGHDQVIAERDAAGHDLHKTELSIGHVEHLHLDGASPARAPSAVPRQLPAPVSDFIGRDEELAKLLEGVRGGGATISGVAGMAGVGKTELAFKLARQIAGDYPDGQLYLNLRGADPEQQTPLTPAEAMRHVLLGFDLTRTLPEEEDALRAAYHTELTGRRALLLMDNAADREQVEPLIPPDGCLLLVTSRQHFVLPGLTPLNLDTLDEEPARDLLLGICERIGEHAARIAKLCGRLPLALRVAGSTLAERPAMAAVVLIERLEAKPLEQLDEVERAIAVSDALLEEGRRGHFHALSVFPGSFERVAAGKVLELEPNAADDALDELVRCSLLQWDSDTGRYGMHDLVRLFADTRLSQDRRDALRMRHARVYRDVLAAADDLYLQHGEKTFEGLALFDREWGNIQAGFAAVSARVGSNEDAARLCSGYPDAAAHCLALRQTPSERIEWLKAALTAARRLDDAAMEAAHLGNLGLIYERRGDLDKAEEMQRKSLEIDEKLGSVEGMANDYGSLGLIYQTRGDLDEGERLYRKALEIDEKLGRLQGMASVYGNLGSIFEQRGDLDEAERMYGKALEIDEKLGRLEGMANAYGNLGIIYQTRGDLDQAEQMHCKSLEIEEKLGRLEGMAADYGNLGNIYQTRGDLDKAEQMQRKALEINEKLGRLEGMANQYGNLGLIFEQRGDGNGARRLWTQARDLYARIGMPHMVDKVQGWLDGLPDAKE